jgi:hypothetical protein
MKETTKEFVYKTEAVIAREGTELLDFAANRVGNLGSSICWK